MVVIASISDYILMRLVWTRKIWARPTIKTNKRKEFSQWFCADVIILFVKAVCYFTNLAPYLTSSLVVTCTLSNNSLQQKRKKEWMKYSANAKKKQFPNITHTEKEIAKSHQMHTVSKIKAIRIIRSMQV